MAEITNNIMKDLVNQTNAYFDKVEVDEDNKTKEKELTKIVKESISDIANISRDDVLNTICSCIKSGKTYNKRARIDSEIDSFIKKVKEITSKPYNTIINELLRLIVDHKNEIEKIQYFYLEEEQKHKVKELVENLNIESSRNHKSILDIQDHTISKTLVLDEDVFTFVTMVDDMIDMKATHTVNLLLRELILK